LHDQNQDKMKKYLACLLLFIGIGDALAQNYKYQIGVDGGYTTPSQGIILPDEEISSNFSFNAGVQIQDHLSKRWQLDYGIIYKNIAYSIEESLLSSRETSLSSIELPIIFRYKCFKSSKFNFTPGLGFRPSFLLKERTTWTTGNDINESISRNEFNIGASLSLAFEYQMNDRWKLRIDPVYTARLSGYNDLSLNFGVYRSISDITIQGHKELYNDKETLDKNAISLTAGYGIVIASFQIGYERIFWEKRADKNQALYGNINLGGFSSFDEDMFSSIRGGYLIGKANKYLDISFGVLTIDPDSPYMLPSGSVGYRYQNNGIQFRTGIGFIEGVYIGFGRTF
jgi:hypothetical protein